MDKRQSASSDATPSCPTANKLKIIDRSKLLDSLAKPWYGSTQVLTWHGKVQQNIFNHEEIESLYVKGVGPIGVPLSMEDIEVIKQRVVQRKNKMETNGCEVQGNQLVIIAKGEEKTSGELFHELPYSVLEEMLEIDFTHLNATIECRCEKLVVCEKGQSHEIVHSNAKEPGMFGTLLLQMPVITELHSGTISLNHESKEATSCNFDDNQVCQSAAVALSRGSSPPIAPKHVIQSHPEGVVAVMVFNLVWVEYLGLSNYVPPENIVEVFIRAYEISRILAAWNPRNDITEAESKESVTESGEKEFSCKIDAEKNSFLCISLKGLLDAKLGLVPWNISESDALKMKILSMISFIDVDVAYMGCSYQWYIQQGLRNELYSPQYRNLKISWDQPNKPKFTLNYVRFRKRSIKRNLNDCKIDGEINLVGEFKIAFMPSPNTQTISHAILVICPRMPICPLSRQLSTNELNSIDLFKASLIHWLSSYRMESTLSACRIRRNLLSDVDFLFDTIEQLGPHCAANLKYPSAFTRDIFKICAFLKAEKHGLRAANYILSVYTDADWFQPNYWLSSHIDPAYQLAEFIRLTSSWEACSAPLFQMLAVESISKQYLLRLADTLISKGCKEEANEIVDKSLSILINSTEQKQTEWLQLHGYDLILSAVKLDKKAESERSERTLSWVNRYPSYLVADIFKDLTSPYHKNYVDSSRWISKIWASFTDQPTYLSTLNWEICFTFADVFMENGEEECLRSFYQDILSNCIEDSTGRSLFYDIVTKKLVYYEENYRQVLVFENREKLLEKFVSFPSSKEALVHLIDRLDDFSSEEIAEIFSFTQYLGKVDDDVNEKFDSLFAIMDQNKLVGSAAAMFSATNITKDNTLASSIFESLLKKILSEQLTYDFITSPACFSEFVEAVVWFGNEDLVLKLLERLPDDCNIYEAISKALHAKNDGENNAASSLRFKRDIFDAMVLYWIKLIKNLNQPDRAENATDCLFLLITAEKSFIDSINEEIVSAFRQMIEDLEVHECIKVTTAVFKSEIENDNAPKLKKFPACWSLFSCLCERVSSQLNHQLVRGLERDERVHLMQSFFWLSEEKHLTTFCKAINDCWRFALEVITDQRTAELALGSRYGLIALDDLMDTIIASAPWDITNLRTLRKKILFSLAMKTEIAVDEVRTLLTAPVPSGSIRNMVW